MNVLDDFDYDLPPELVAQEPARARDASRLLVLDRKGDASDLEILPFRGILSHLDERDVLVVNDARVFPARLRFALGEAAPGEALLLEPVLADGEKTWTWDLSRAGPSWEALVRPARRVRRIITDTARRLPLIVTSDAGRVRETGIELELVRELGGGRFELRVLDGGRPLSPPEVIELCDRVGVIPLPPYIRRKAADALRESDRQRYQTVYAHSPCAVAAPTAGLHFTVEILDELRRRGVETLSVTHQVGIGTFLPLRERELDRSKLHAEWTSIDAETASRLAAARRRGRRVVAVGTTTVRALESFAAAGMPSPYRERTELFIRPGHVFRLVDAMVTNFHLPRSSLLVLVSAFAGRDRILDAYHFAIANRLRFYSYGDAMLII